MKQFLLFGGQIHSSNGGFNDLFGEADDLKTAKSIAVKAVEENEICEWWHIVDLTTREIVAKSEAEPDYDDAGSMLFLKEYNNGTLSPINSIEDDDED